MKTMLIIGALGLAFSLQACSQAEEQAPEATAEAAPAAADEMASMAAAEPRAAPAAAAGAGPFRTTGKVTSVAGSKITIDHQAVEGLGWPAMTMSFEAPEEAMLQGLQPGANVNFAFRKDGQQYVLTEIRRQ